MNDINHFAVSSILNSEIVGRSKFGHGQIDSREDAQRYFDLLGITESPEILHGNEEIDPQKVIAAFHAVRNARGDQGSPDLYIADPERNAVFLAKCREFGLCCSDYLLNKTLMNARRHSLLRGLHSVRTRTSHEDYAFACEFAATELKYRTGASIADIICDPNLAARFDAIASKLAPGFSSCRYRCGLLSIGKAGRHTAWKPSYRMPKFTGRFQLVKDPLENMPEDRGVYLLHAVGKERPLYARSTEHLRHAIALHRRPQQLSAILDKFWKPNLENFLVSYAVLPTSKLLKPVEKKIIQERKPIFNVPRVA
jgi:site-specific DNA-methyltransferase (adenine-specific)